MAVGNFNVHRMRKSEIMKIRYSTISAFRIPHSTFLFVWIIVLILISACASQPVILVEPLPGYDALFERQEGWTGADGVYSVPLSDSTLPYTVPAIARIKLLPGWRLIPGCPGMTRFFYTGARGELGPKYNLLCRQRTS
jgi:hypothetical protein